MNNTLKEIVWPVDVLLGTVEFNGEECEIYSSVYPSTNRFAISLWAVVANEPMAIATTNIPEMPQMHGYTFIKNWSENTGILDALIGADIIEAPEQEFRAGFCYVQICRITDRVLALLQLER